MKWLWTAAVLGALVVAGLISDRTVSGQTSPSSDRVKILEFHTMVGVPRPFTGATNAIRGIPGGGIPWRVDRAQGVLRADGEIDVRVRGLVLAEGANAGRNPIAQFKAIVSCLTVQNGAATTVNVSTDLFPASPEGDAVIRDTVELPNPCIAPIVFVTSPTGSWFAATGF
jgi:hypothetical protein